MRLLLETYALPLSFAAGDLEWESRVVAAHHKLAFMERRMMAGDQEGTELWKRYDREFHQCPDRGLRLADPARSLWRRLRPVSPLSDGGSGLPRGDRRRGAQDCCWIAP